MMERLQFREVQVKESRWAEEIPQRWKQPKGEDRTGMVKEEKRLRCILLNGSAWRKNMRRHTGKCDILGTEHREGGNAGAVEHRGEGRMVVCG